MKKIILVCLLMVGMLQVMVAQTAAKEKEESNAEKFSAKSGTLMQKEFLKIGKLGAAEIEVLKYTDLISNEKSSGLRFSKDVVKSYTSDTKIAVLDADEVDGLIKSIKIIQNQILSTKEVYTEINYRSRSGFQAGCYYEVRDAKWTAYIKIEKYDSDSYVWLKTEDLTQLLTLLEQAKLKL